MAARGANEKAFDSPSSRSFSSSLRRFTGVQRPRRVAEQTEASLWTPCAKRKVKTEHGRRVNARLKGNSSSSSTAVASRVRERETFLLFSSLSRVLFNQRHSPPFALPSPSIRFNKFVLFSVSQCFILPQVILHVRGVKKRKKK